MVNITDNAIESRNDVDFGLFGNDLALNLVTHSSHGIFRRSNEGHTDLIQSLDKSRVLGQETITWVYGLGTSVLDSLDDVGDVKVTLRSRCRTLKETRVIPKTRRNHRIRIGSRIKR